MAFNFPNSPALGDTYVPSSGQTYTWDGNAWIVTTDGGAVSTDYVMKTGDVMTGSLRLPTIAPSVGTEATHKDYVDQSTVSIAGDTMTGALQLPAAMPVAPTEAAHKDYVDQSIAASSLYQGVWQPGPNIPDLTPSVVNALHSYSWIAITADPTIPELAPGALPGIGGLAIAESDTIIWNDTTSMYELVRAPASGTGAFLPIIGGTMTGGISFGAAAASAVTDLSRHLILHTAGFGFSITANTLNYNTDPGSSHKFHVGGVEKVRITSGGLDAVTGLWIYGQAFPYVSPAKVTNGGWGSPTNKCYASQSGKIVTVSGYLDASSATGANGVAFTLPAGVAAPRDGYAFLIVSFNGVILTAMGLEVNSSKQAIVKGASTSGWVMVSGSYCAA